MVSKAERRHRESPTVLHVALIFDGAEICRMFVEASPRLLTRGIARYASEQASFQLLPRDQKRFNELLVEGREREAVELYFERGGRWAPERLIEGRYALTHSEAPS